MLLIPSPVHGATMLLVMLRRRLPRPPKPPPMLLAGPVLSVLVLYLSTIAIDSTDSTLGRRTAGRRALIEGRRRPPTSHFRHSWLQISGDSTPFLHRILSVHVYSAGLSQKEATLFRETGRHGMGSQNQGVGACVECRCTTLRSHKS